MLYYAVKIKPRIEVLNIVEKWRKIRTGEIIWRVTLSILHLLVPDLRLKILKDDDSRPF